MSSVRRLLRHCLGGGLTVVVATVGLVAVGGLTQGAAACVGGASCGGGAASSGRTITVTVTGTLVRGGSGGSGGGGSVTVAAPTPCGYEQGMTGKEYFEWVGSPAWNQTKRNDPDGHLLTARPGYRQYKDDTQGHWYGPSCTYGGDDFPIDDWSDFVSEFFDNNESIYVEAGETPPIPDVPPEVLLAAAQEAMEVPEPAFEFNPDATGAIDTLVNLETWLWLTDPTQSGSVTASIPTGDSVTVDATLTDVTFTSPAAGTIACDGTGTRYTPGAASDCSLTFDQAGPADITADTQWALEWSYNGQPQGAIDPLVASFTDGLVVGESQAIVDEVD